MDYWEECISGAFDEAGIEATKDQIDTVVSWVDGAHDNYGMAFGHDCIPNPLESEIEKIRISHADEIKELQNREQCYKESVARRRGTSPGNVWIENGKVRYER